MTVSGTAMASKPNRNSIRIGTPTSLCATIWSLRAYRTAGGLIPARRPIIHIARTKNAMVTVAGQDDNEAAHDPRRQEPRQPRTQIAAHNARPQHRQRLRPAHRARAMNHSTAAPFAALTSSTRAGAIAFRSALALSRLQAAIIISPTAPPK